MFQAVVTANGQVRLVNVGFSGHDHFKWPSAPSQLAIVRGGGHLNDQVRIFNSRVSGNNHRKWPSAPCHL